MIESELLKIQIEREADRLREYKSPDYRDGFQDCLELMNYFMEELLKIYFGRKNDRKREGTEKPNCKGAM